MKTQLRGKDVLTTYEWEREELETVLDVAKDLKGKFATDHSNRVPEEQDFLHRILQSVHENTE